MLRRHLAVVLYCAAAAACSPTLNRADVVGDWSASPKTGDAPAHLTFAQDGSFDGRIPGDMAGLPLTPVTATGRWTLVQEEGRQKVLLEFAVPTKFGGELFVLRGDTGGLRLTYYRGDPDEGDTFDFRKVR